MTGWPTSTFTDGPMHAFVSRDTIALADVSHERTTSTLWELVAADAPLDEILEVLSGAGLSTLPAFGLARLEDDGIRVVVRGDVTAEVRTPDGDVSLEASAVRTWLESFHAGATAVRLEGAGAAGDERRPFEVLAGVVPAGSVRRVVAEEDPRAASAERAWIRPIRPASPEPVSDVASPELADDRPGPTPAPGPAFGPPAGPAVADGGVAPSEPTPPGTFDDIYGRTYPQTVEGAAVREPSTAGPSVTSAAPVVVVGPDELGDHDGLTVSRRTRRAGGDAAPGAPSAAMVAAVRCVDGHLNPPDADRCRVCARPPGPAPPVQVPRPPLGVLTFSTGERVVLDRPLLIGRNPKLASGSHDELPRFVRIDAAGQGLSRTHAEVRIDGWRVLLVDKGSSNGTEVVIPGQPSRRLQPGDPVPIGPGSTIDLGGEVTVTFEAAP